MGISICLEHSHFRAHKHKRKMEYSYPWNLKFGNICYSTKHNQEKGRASSECYKSLAGTLTGTSLTLALGASRPAQAPSWQEEPDLLDVIITIEAEVVARKSPTKVKVHLPLWVKEKLSGIFCGQPVYLPTC